jgi:hypothetical protein
MTFLRRFFGRKPAPRREIQLLAVDQQCLRALFNADRSLSDDEVTLAVQAERPELDPMEIQASLLKLRQVGLVERDELARHHAAKAARGLRSIIPQRATSNMVYYG